MTSAIPTSSWRGDVPRRVAVFRALQLGDMLCAVPALRAIRAGLPRARISLVGLPWACEFAARFSSYVDDFLEFPGWEGLPEREQDPAELTPFLRRASSAEFDLAIQMHGSGIITNEVVSLLGARELAGFHPRGIPPKAAGHWLEYVDEGREAERLLRLVSFLGFPTSGTELEFPVAATEEREADELLARLGLAGGGYALIHPGARASDRRWSAAGFAAVAGWLSGHGIPVLLTGTRGEACITADVARQAPSAANDLSGRTTLGVLGALVANARVVIANDTGVSHIAAATRTPSVILFTGSEPARWAPPDSSLHRPVRASAGDLRDIDVLAVTRELEDLVSQGAAHATV